MRLTPILLGFLNRVFNKDPKQFRALQIAYNGQMVWTIADQVLTTTVVGGTGTALSIDLTQYTVAGLAAFLRAQTGYSVPFSDSARAGLSACVLIDGSNNVAFPGGNYLYGYTSVWWALMDAYASELQTAEGSVALAPAMMQTTTATGSWLDVLGAVFDVIRNQGEPDNVYGPRIIAQTLRPAQNNFALANTIEYFTSYAAEVNDADASTPSFLFNGAVNFDGSHEFQSTGGNIYGIFDVIVHTGAGLSASAWAAVVASIKAIIQVARAGGTNVRNITQTS